MQDVGLRRGRQKRAIALGDVSRKYCVSGDLTEHCSATIKGIPGAATRSQPIPPQNNSPWNMPSGERSLIPFSFLASAGSNLSLVGDGKSWLVLI
jgi:hypothetical protein